MGSHTVLHHSLDSFHPWGSHIQHMRVNEDLYPAVSCILHISINQSVIEHRCLNIVLDCCRLRLLVYSFLPTSSSLANFKFCNFFLFLWSFLLYFICVCVQPKVCPNCFLTSRHQMGLEFSIMKWRNHIHWLNLDIAFSSVLLGFGGLNFLHSVPKYSFGWMNLNLIYRSLQSHMKAARGGLEQDSHEFVL